MHRKWTPKEKMEIVLEGLRDEGGISGICRSRGISTTQFYNWKNLLMSSAEMVFQRQTNKLNLKEERLKQENERMKGVIVEITAENLDLKKGLGG